MILSFKRISSHTYTHETLIQAAFNDFVIKEVPVRFKRRKFGSSRLITSVPAHIFKSVVVILRALLMYKALSVFTTLGSIFIGIGTLGVLRFIYFYILGEGAGHIQSLVISAIFVNLGLTAILIGIIADLISIYNKNE